MAIPGAERTRKWRAQKKKDVLTQFQEMALNNKCYVCNKGPKDGVQIFRKDDKNHSKKWFACADHYIIKDWTEMELSIINSDGGFI